MSLAIPPRVRKQVWERDSGWCVRCFRPLTPDVPHSFHHRRPRMMGGTTDPRINDPRNIVLLCGTGTTGCHGWIEQNRSFAKHVGYLLESLDDEELDRPILTLWGRVALTRDGERHEVPKPTAEEANQS